MNVINAIEKALKKFDTMDVFIYGGPGMGKTELLEQIQDHFKKKLIVEPYEDYSYLMSYSSTLRMHSVGRQHMKIRDGVLKIFALASYSKQTIHKFYDPASRHLNHGFMDIRLDWNQDDQRGFLPIKNTTLQKFRSVLESYYYRRRTKMRPYIFMMYGYNYNFLIPWQLGSFKKRSNRQNIN